MRVARRLFGRASALLRPAAEGSRNVCGSAHRASRFRALLQDRWARPRRRSANAVSPARASPAFPDVGLPRADPRRTDPSAAAGVVREEAARSRLAWTGLALASPRTRQ